MSATINRDIRKWSRDTQNILKRDLRALTRDGKMRLLKSIKTKTKQSFGEIDRVVFPFQRHGIFLQYGVSRGHKKDNPRKIRNWLRALYDDETPEINSLAELLAEHRADAAVKTLK